MDDRQKIPEGLEIAWLRAIDAIQILIPEVWKSGFLLSNNKVCLTLTRTFMLFEAARDLKVLQIFL